MPNIEIDLSGINDIVLPVFRPLLYDKNPVILMRGSRGSGKSYFWAQEIVYRVLADLNTCKHNIIVLRKWSEHCDKSVVKQIKKVISDWGISELVSHNKIEKSFKFPNGSQIACMGANDPERLKSITDVTSLVLEEATEFSGDDFATLDLSMRGDHGTYLQSILSFNPINVSNWVYTRFYEHGQLPGVTYHHSTFRDNPYVGKNYSERIEALCGQNDYLRRVLMEGEWGAVKGLIYDPSQWTIARPERLESESIYGLDFGWNHPTALIQATRIDDDTFYLKELVYASELTNIDLIGRMKAMDIGRKYIYADGARPEIIEEIFKARFNIHPADKKPGSVWSGITFCKRFRFILDPESTNLIDEFRSYSWKVNKQGVTLDEPVKEKDDACFVAGTLIDTDKGKKRIELINAGDMVLTRKGYKRVINAGCTGIKEVKTFNIGGNVLICTPDHSIITTNGKVPVNKLSDKDTIFIKDINSQSINIQKQYVIQGVDETGIRVYNLTVEDEHEYFANNVLVANCDAARYAIFTHLNKKVYNYGLVA